MLDILNKYTNKGSFEYSPNDDDLFKICTAPADQSGVYLFYKETEDINNLIYIGCSGRMKQVEFYNRKGGLKQRITKGGQFKGKRIHTLKIKMEEDGIKRLKVHWYVTFEKNLIKHLPAYVEGLLIQEYFNKFGKLPAWNIQY